MKTKYYVCGMNGIITSHRKLKCAEKAYKKRLRSMYRRNMTPTISLRKTENEKHYVYENNTWREVNSLIVSY